MTNGEIMAHAIGILKNSVSITIEKLMWELNIEEKKAKIIIREMIDLDLVVNFGNFYACVDLADLN